ncbi:MAG: DUF3791 domain-containing protein [Anaerostipes sp.]|jgi:hypothetical protein
MQANPILLQKKYARVVDVFAKGMGISLREALDFFYHSTIYKDMSEGVSDMHCRSEEYLAEELQDEYVKTTKG